MKQPARVVVLGCGYAGTAVARLARARGLEVVATVRSEDRAEALRSAGFEVIAAPSLEPDIAARTRALADTHVVVAFPPDGSTDARVAQAFAGAGSIAYVSTTGVYGDLRGEIDDDTPTPNPPAPRAARVLDAERAWRAAGATVLRSPGIYGPDRGLHVRVARGLHKLPGDGTRFLSRIHVEDLAQLLLAAANVRGETFVVGDLAPAPQAEVCAWIAEVHRVPLPPAVPLEEVHETLRADRRVDARRALAALGVELLYPSYREGMRELRLPAKSA